VMIAQDVVFNRGFPKASRIRDDGQSGKSLCNQQTSEGSRNS